MTKLFFKFKKPYFWHFWPIFPILGAKKVFHEIKLLCATSYGFLAPCQNSEKSNDPISRKHPDSQEARMHRPYFIGSFQLLLSGGKGAQTLFHRILPATASGLTSKTAVNWHLKVKDIEKMLALPSYCITVSMQKNQLNS